VDAALARAVQTPAQLPEAGATRAAALDGAPLPHGFTHRRVTRRVGTGRDDVATAAACVLGWGMHRGAGIAVTATTPQARVGTTVVCSIGVGLLRLLAPCRVVWTVDEPDRQGFGYVALPGHPEVGEEAFVVRHDPADGAVLLDVVVFARAGRWYTRVGSPLLPLVQRVAIAAYGRAVARAVRRSRVSGRP
jgi:uncharacterized protein (UPF0548 family)